MKKSRLTPEEIQEILSQSFSIFPEPSPEAKAKGITKKQPSTWQKPAFMWEYPWSDRVVNKNGLHTHYLDMILAYGARGGGKTLLGAALNAFFLTSFPGCRTLCGADVFNDVEKLVFPKLKALFSIKSDWDHPWVKTVPSVHKKQLELVIPVFNEEKNRWEEKTSICDFMHFSEWQRLRGNEYSFAHLEEVSQLQEAIVAEEIERSLRSSLTPFRIFYAATNPPESMSHWIYDKWDLTPYMDNPPDEKPEPILCKCQFCQTCLNNKSEEWLYGEDGYCSNPYCAFLDFCKENQLPLRKEKQSSYIIPFGHKDSRNKPLSCPGNQPWRRIIHSETLDNPHLAADLVQNLKAGQDQANFEVFTLGKVRTLTSNKVFPSFDYRANTFWKEVPIDPNRDIYWSHDHNTRPRCSVIIQVRKENDEPYIDVVDEIVKYDVKIPKTKMSKEELIERGIEFKEENDSWVVKKAGPEHVAQDFIEKYKDWNEESILLGSQKEVILHGDHTALNTKMSPFSKNEFQIIYDLLIKAGFKVSIAVKKVKGSKIQINVSDRLAVTNWLLKDDQNKSRIRINRKCKNLLKSLEDLEKSTKDGEPIDKSCDEKAAKATNTDKIHLISHPSEALGYMLCRCFNIIKEPEGFRFIFINSGQLLDINYETGEVTERNIEPEKQKDPFSLLDMVRSYVESEANQSELDAISQFQDFYR